MWLRVPQQESSLEDGEGAVLQVGHRALNATGSGRMEKEVDLHLNGTQSQGCRWTARVDLLSPSCPQRPSAQGQQGFNGATQWT